MTYCWLLSLPLRVTYQVMASKVAYIVPSDHNCWCWSKVTTVVALDVLFSIAQVICCPTLSVVQGSTFPQVYICPEWCNHCISDKPRESTGSAVVVQDWGCIRVWESDVAIAVSLGGRKRHAKEVQTSKYHNTQWIETDSKNSSVGGQRAWLHHTGALVLLCYSHHSLWDSGLLYCFHSWGVLDSPNMMLG